MKRSISPQEKMGQLVRLFSDRDQLQTTRFSEEQIDFTSSSTQTRLFLEENRQKRADKLVTHLQILEEAFANFSDLIRTYTESSVLEPFTNVTDDASKFLDWLHGNSCVSEIQADWLIYQRACHELERLARLYRCEYLKFHTFRKMELSSKKSSSCNIMLNPVHLAIQFKTVALLDEGMQPPVDVIVFACDGQIQTAALTEKVMAEWFISLKARLPCRQKEWALSLRSEVRNEALDFLDYLYGFGIIAFNMT